MQKQVVKDQLDFKNLKLLKYVLSYTDGQSNILDIANNSNFKLSEINKVVNFVYLEAINRIKICLLF